MMKRNSQSICKRKGYLWITSIFLIFSLALHWIFGGKAFVNDQMAHDHSIVFSDYAVEMASDTFESWQSEFLQLIGQVAGPAFLLYAGSPQSKDGDNRKEEKLDFIVHKLDPENYSKLLKK